MLHGIKKLVSHSHKTIFVCTLLSSPFLILNLRYAPLRQCISKLPSGGVQKWPELWHKQLVSVKPQSVSADTKTSKKDTEKWSEIVSDVYLERLAVNWSSVRNVMDMNAGFGG